MPQQVPISNSEGSQEAQQQVEGALREESKSSPVSENKSNDIKNGTQATVSNSIPRRTSAGSNCNKNVATTTTNNYGANNITKNTNIVNSNHDNPINSNNGNTNNINSNSKPSTKLNGLKNRIIQRPPPLILDKVSNFYDNQTCDVANNCNQQTASSAALTSTAASSNKGHIYESNNYVNQYHQETAIDHSLTKLAANSVHQQSRAGDEPVNIQSNYNAPSSTTANQKFWASLNENASRKKALANARHIDTKVATQQSSSKPSSPAQAATEPISYSTDALGADLIISHRNSCGTLSTSQIITSSSGRRRSLQTCIQHTQPETAHENQAIKQHQLTVSSSIPLDSTLSSQVNNFTERTHNVSNNSTEPDEGRSPNENDGGNLIGVESSSPLAIDDHILRGEEIPVSATSRRSTNPFIDSEEESENENEQTRGVVQVPANSFHKRPASFIAATEKVVTSKRAPGLMSQQVLEEQSNDLQLNDKNELYSTGQMFPNALNPQIFQPQPGALLINERQTMTASTFDQRDSSAPSHPNPSYLTQQNLQYQSSANQPSQPIYGTSNSYNSNSTSNRFIEPAISLDSESAICQPPPSTTMQLPHWTEAIYELKYATLEASSVAGGAENGQFIYIIETGDIVLEIDKMKVSGFTLVEFIELIDSKQFHLRAVQVKHSQGLTLDLKSYLCISFPRNSEDKQLQNLIRENIYRRTIPCTTRPPKPGEVDKVDYHFLTKEHFHDMNNKGMLLECGVYSDHYYGTLKPFCDPTNLTNYQSANQQHQQHQPQWDANHPAIDIKRGQNEFEQSIGNNFVEHPLYENHESLKINQQRANNFEVIANQNGLQLEHMITPEGLKQSSIVAVDSESLPPGWERVIDQTHGTYYIDHNTQRTQYERPYEIELTKGHMGFGFTLVEADNSLLLVRSIIPGGPAHSNGQIRPGDILVSAVGVSVAGLQHTDIARLFSTFAVGDRVRLTFARSTYVVDDTLIPDEYLFSNGTNGDLAIAVNSNNYHNYCLNQNISDQQLGQLQQQFHLPPSHQILVDQEFEFIQVKLKRGDQGFGFTISDSIAGQKVRKIQNHEICSNLKQGDILTVLNDEDVTKLTHKEVVERLKRCPAGEDVTLTVKRKKRFRSKTPMAMHTDQASDGYSLDLTPQRNCKTPSLDGLMLKRPINYNSSELPVSRNLFSNQSATTTTTAGTTTVPASTSVAHQASTGFLINGLPTHPATSHGSPATRVYAPLPHHIRPQPIYGSSESAPNERPDRQEYYSNGQHHSLPPMTTYINSIDVRPAQQTDDRPNSNPPANSNYGTSANLSNHHPAQAPELVLPPALPPTKPNLHNMNGLTQLNQYNNFMNNDKLIMMQMQQPNYANQLAHQQQLGSMQHMQFQSATDYHQMPLYSNSELINDELSAPQVPAKPAMNQYMQSLYHQQANQQQYQNNLYANNEEITLQRTQYGESKNQFVMGPPQMTPMSDQLAFMHSSQFQYGVHTPLEEQDEYECHEIDLDRENTESNWGIRLIGGAEVDRAISIGSIVFGGAASKNGKLKSGDEIISINGINVVGATHQHVVELISACTNRASLVVRRKKFAEACEVVLERNPNEGFGFVIISSGNCALIGRIIDGSPADRCQQLHVRDRIIAVNGRYITPNMQHPEIVNMIKDCGSLLRLRIIPIDCYTVELIKNSKSDNFGFSMRGGSEYDGTPLYILRVAQDGLARDLLNVGDQILEINNIPTVGMTHQQAATIIKYSDPIVKLKLRRNYVTPPSLLVDSPRALQKINSVTAEMKTVNLNPTPNTFMNDATSSSICSTDMCAAALNVAGSFGLPADGQVGQPAHGLTVAASPQSAPSVTNLTGYHHSQQQQPMTVHDNYTNANNTNLALYAT